MSEEKTYKFKVAMTCNGCLDAVKRSLNKNLGPDKIKSIEGDLKEQSVTVKTTGPESEGEVLEIVKKAGKDCHVFGKEEL